MDFSCFNLLGCLIDLDFSISRLHDISKSIESSQVRSFYDDLTSLYVKVDSICHKYYKN